MYTYISTVFTSSCGLKVYVVRWRTCCSKVCITHCATKNPKLTFVCLCRERRLRLWQQEGKDEENEDNLHWGTDSDPASKFPDWLKSRWTGTEMSTSTEKVDVIEATCNLPPDTNLGGLVLCSRYGNGGKNEKTTVDSIDARCNLRPLTPIHVVWFCVVFWHGR